MPQPAEDTAITEYKNLKINFSIFHIENTLMFWNLRIN